MRSGMWLGSCPLETIQIRVCLGIPVTMAITCHLGMCFLVSKTKYRKLANSACMGRKEQILGVEANEYLFSM